MHYINRLWLISIVQNCSRALLRLLYFQLFIITISTPLLIWWGLPISLMSPLGNIFFGFFLTLFLLLSSLIFFLELIFIPTYPLLWLLENITRLWFICCTWGSSYWLIRFPLSFLPLFIVIAILALFIVGNKRFITNEATCTFILFILLSLPVVLYKQVPFPNKSITLSKKTKDIQIFRKDGHTIIVDKGYLSKMVKDLNVVLLPLITKSFGASTIDAIITTHPSASTFKVLHKVIKKIPVNNLYIAPWSGHLSRLGLNSWYQLLAAAKEYQVNIHMITDPTAIRYDSKDLFHLTPLSTKKFQSGTLRTQAIDITCKDS